MNKEIFKNVVGYEGLYQVSNLGRVWSNISNKYLSPRYKRNGYVSVVLSSNGESKQFRIHRLVALAFIPNPNNYPEINHKNEIKDDNRVDNLEWCDRKYNMNYGSIKEKISENNKGEKNPHYGKHHTEETKERIRMKMKIINSGENHPWWGKHHSEESKNKISLARKKKIAQYSLDGKLIKIWDSGKDATSELGLSYSAISNCINGRCKTSGGFIWKPV